MNKRIVDIVSLATVGAIVGGIALANLIQPNRPTVSEAENRTLAEMPEFSMEALADGSYFSGISTFISDTFVERDRLVTLSKRLDVLKGIDYKIEGADSFVLLEGVTKTPDETEPDNTSFDDLFAAAFDSLNQTSDTDRADSEPETSAGTDEGNKQAAGNEIETDPAETEPAETEIEPAETEPVETEPDAAETEPVETEPNPAETEPAETEPDAAETEPAETDPDPVETEPVETEPEPVETDPAETEPPEPEVRGLSLSRTSISLTIGSGTVLYAYLDADEPGNVSWSISDKSIATIAGNPNGGIDVKGVAEGTCTLTCKYQDLFEVTCSVTVSSIPTTSTPIPTDAQADFLTDGMFIYGDAVYTQAFYSEYNAKYYAQTAAYYKSLFGENTRMNIVVAPVSSMVVDNEAVKARIPDQRDIFDKMAALVDPSVNFVDTYTPMYDHRSEYLFFKSDHHWTQRGAYYAYTAFAESIGLTPTPLDDFDYLIRNESYSGSMYMYTQDARVRYFTDVIEAFVSKKPHTMTVTGQYGTVYNYDTTVVSTNSTYVTFIAGDNPYTVINVPENPQDFNALVLKDSFGNAFVPFLCEHYGNIIVVDTRYSTFNIYEQLKDYGISDIIFVNNIQAANSSIWWQMYLSAVGVSTN